jgi:hypothetical protein
MNTVGPLGKGNMNAIGIRQNNYPQGAETETEIEIIQSPAPSMKCDGQFSLTCQTIAKRIQNIHYERKDKEVISKRNLKKIWNSLFPQFATNPFKAFIKTITNDLTRCNLAQYSRKQFRCTSGSFDSCGGHARRRI